MTRAAIVNGVRSHFVETSREGAATTPGAVNVMASASLPGLVYVSASEPLYEGESFDLAQTAVVYLTPARARELGLALIETAARVAPDAELGGDDPYDDGAVSAYDAREADANTSLNL